jgi:hypothetical protein
LYTIVGAQWNEVQEARVGWPRISRAFKLTIVNLHAILSLPVDGTGIIRWPVCDPGRIGKSV